MKKIIIIAVILWLIPLAVSIKLLFDFRDIKRELVANNSVTVSLVQYASTGDEKVLQNIVRFLNQ